MNRYLLNQNWEFIESDLAGLFQVMSSRGWQKTDLPHDRSVEVPRTPQAAAGANEGYLDARGLFYRKSFVLAEEAASKRLWLEFEGVAGVTQVWVNGRFLMKHQNPYTSFWAEITSLVKLGENEIVIHVDNRMKPDSRWYVGCGIYRSVWLHTGAAVTVEPHTLHAVTVGLERNTAKVEVTGRLTGSGSVAVEVVDRDGVVVSTSSAAVDGLFFRAGLTVENARLWSPAEPYLYTVRAVAAAGDGQDTAEIRTGFRTVAVNSREGFLLNGQPMKLKGGCIHHDLGLLGAADFPAAERRKVRILQENGFNALRLAHNPFGPALLEACDEMGMLVIEEAFDEWVIGKTSFGLHLTFENRWEQDLEDMIDRDRSHPCIIMWSTGNEVEERDGSADGYAWSGRLAEKVKTLDPSRPVSAAACAVAGESSAAPTEGTTGNQALNMVEDRVEQNDVWGTATAPYFAPLDVAGYNYKTARYIHDKTAFPDRVIYGSESYPTVSLQNWQAVQNNANVIGDFVWTAWDYLGESGVGRWEVKDAYFPGPVTWPWLTAGCGDIDLIGEKCPQSYYRDVVWEQSHGPKIFCLPPQMVGKHIAKLQWAWPPVERNYTFAGYEGRLVEVHIYAKAGEVELLVNGISAGKQPCTNSDEFKTIFTIPYQPGTLEAVAYMDGLEIGRDVLTSSRKTARFDLSADRDAISDDGQDLCFVTISAADADGHPVFAEDGEISVTAEGGVLWALGNADPKPDRALPFRGTVCPLYQGQALAVIKGGRGANRCTVTVRMGNIESSLTISLLSVLNDPDCPVQELQFEVMDMPLGELFVNERTKELLSGFFGKMLDTPVLEMVAGVPLKKVLEIAKLTMSSELVQALNEALE